MGRYEEGLGVDGKIIFKKKTDLQEEGWASMSWIDLAQKMDKQWVIVNAVMNIRVP